MKGKRTREGTEGRGWEKRRGGPPNANSWIRACALIRRGTIRFELKRTLYITVNVERTWNFFQPWWGHSPISGYAPVQRYTSIVLPSGQGHQNDIVRGSLHARRSLCPVNNGKIVNMCIFHYTFLTDHWPTESLFLLWVKIFMHSISDFVRRDWKTRLVFPRNHAEFGIPRLFWRGR